MGWLLFTTPLIWKQQKLHLIKKNSHSPWALANWWWPLWGSWSADCWGGWGWRGCRWSHRRPPVPAPGSHFSPGSRLWSTQGCSAPHSQGSLTFFWNICSVMLWTTWLSSGRGQERRVLPGCSKLVAPWQAGNPGHWELKERKSEDEYLETFRLRFFRDCSSPLKAPSARVMLLSENFSVFNLVAHSS